MQNITIEERVALLEIQVTDLEQNVSDLDEDVNFLFDETVLQDERILTLEQDYDVINQDLDGQCEFSCLLNIITNLIFL